MQLGALIPQGVTAETQMNPPAYVGPNETEIDVVVELPVAPVGNVQMYDVAPGTGVIE